MNQGCRFQVLCVGFSIRIPETCSLTLGPESSGYLWTNHNPDFSPDLVAKRPRIYREVLKAIFATATRVLREWRDKTRTRPAHGKDPTLPGIQVLRVATSRKLTRRNTSLATAIGLVRSSIVRTTSATVIELNRAGLPDAHGLLSFFDLSIRHIPYQFVHWKTNLLAHPVP